MTLSQSIIWIDNLMNYLLLRLKRNLLKIICFYFFFEFSTNHGGISAELIIITRNSLLNGLPDMTTHREVNVRHTRIIVARKILIFAYFSAKLCQTLCEINKLNLPCIGWCKFLQKMFFWLEGKTLHVVYQIFARWQRKKRKKKIKLSININFLSILLF